MNSVVKFFTVLTVIVAVPVTLSIFVKNQYILLSTYDVCLSLYSMIQVLFSYLNRI